MWWGDTHLFTTDWQLEKNELALNQPRVVVGKGIEVQWTHGWYRGTITRYAPKTGLHTVHYEDNEIRQYDLSKKVFKMI